MTWIRSPTMAKRVTVVPVAFLAVRRLLRAATGIGRAAAITYAREGADMAINDYLSEEPDAEEVIQLIKV